MQILIRTLLYLAVHEIDYDDNVSCFNVEPQVVNRNVNLSKLQDDANDHYNRSMTFHI